MNIYINGKPFELSSQSAHTVFAALSLFLNDEQQKQTYAVALNGEFVGRSDYQNTAIQSSDRLDVLFPIQGG